MIHPIIDRLKKIVNVLERETIFIEKHGEITLTSDIAGTSFTIAHNLGQMPDIVEWYIDRDSPLTNNGFMGGYYTRSYPQGLPFTPTSDLSVRDNVIGIYCTASGPYIGYERIIGSSESVYINSVTDMNFNIKGTSGYKIPAGSRIKWRVMKEI